jgi:curved DNA-binding protein
VRGRGLPAGKAGAHGDLIVVVAVQLPTHLSPEEKALWQQLSDKSDFNPRKPT